MTTCVRKILLRVTDTARAVSAFARGRRKAIREDFRTIGVDVMKGGVAAVIINGWVNNANLLYAGITAIFVGMLIWLIGLPTDA